MDWNFRKGLMNDIIKFLNASPECFSAIGNIKNQLLAKGYEELFETSSYNIQRGGKYFVTRNGSSLIAFNIGKRLDNPSLQMTASHVDSPALKLKPLPMAKGADCMKLNVELYGGPVLDSWFDRPLGLSGRVMVKKDQRIKSELYDYGKPYCLIPSVAPHLGGRGEGKANPQIDLQPLITMDTEYDLIKELAKHFAVNDCDILGFDLFLYPYEKGLYWGQNDEFFSSGHIDDLACAYPTLMGFIDTFNDDNINVYCAFDNEETGSLSKQGADSDFLYANLKRVTDSLDIELMALAANGMLLSCDNGHALHPNHPEKSDASNRPSLNKGLVIKFNANLHYTSDGISIALFRSLLDDNKIPYQFYANRSDIRGGGTLGNIANAHLSLISVDIGLPQLSMHSIYETAGSKDVDALIAASRAFYAAHLCVANDSFALK